MGSKKDVKIIKEEKRRGVQRSRRADVGGESEGWRDTGGSSVVSRGWEGGR